MEAKINIAEILKDKPQGTKLYDWLHNIDVEFSDVETTEIETSIWCTRNKEDYNELFGYSELGTLRGWFDGLQILFPSKEMRDWGKFAWKKGDVLVNKDGDVHIIFERFVDDTYCSFVGKYYLWKENNNTEQFYENERLLTSDFQKAGKDAAQTYISTIEERLGGKLNLETLEVEKAQPEFKDGDIVVAEEDNYYDKVIFIAAIKDDIVSKALINVRYEDYEVHYNEYRFGSNRSLRLATDSEKQQLFDALAKEGRAWDAEKKQIVDLKPKVELKPFDKVLCRNSKDDTWEADFFARLTRKEIDYTQSGKYLCVGDLWMYCIPYNEETAHLLGTTDEWKGGEQ